MKLRVETPGQADAGRGWAAQPHGGHPHGTRLVSPSPGSCRGGLRSIGAPRTLVHLRTLVHRAHHMADPRPHLAVSESALRGSQAWQRVAVAGNADRRRHGAPPGCCTAAPPHVRRRSEVRGPPAASVARPPAPPSAVVRETAGRPLCVHAQLTRSTDVGCWQLGLRRRRRGRLLRGGDHRGQPRPPGAGRAAAAGDLAQGGAGRQHRGLLRLQLGGVPEPGPVGVAKRRRVGS
jgi:hypothetical protein